MEQLDKTPAPVEVAPRDRAESSGEFSVVNTQRTTAVHSRSLIRGLVVPTIVAATVAGPNSYYALKDARESARQTAIARLESETPPGALQLTQITAASNLFESNGNSENVKKASELANQKARGEYLKASSYIKPEQARLSEDGMSFVVDGKTYYLARKTTAEGNVFIVAGREAEKDLFSNREQLVGLLLVGGAYNDRRSDLNHDGVTTPEEVVLSADISARGNLENGFRPPQELSFGRTAQNKIK